MLRAAFKDVDITPPVGTLKIGWLIRIESNTVIDPLYARVAVLSDGGTTLGLVQLDTLSIRWSQVDEIRRRIHQRCGVPPSHILVGATHNHAGPAVATFGETVRDTAYIEELIQRVVDAFEWAWRNREPAKIGFASGFEWRVAHNRRVVMRDGTVKTHGDFTRLPDALCLEGPIDPEVAVIDIRSVAGKKLGCIVNFTCHPTHHGGDQMLSAGYPGCLAAELKKKGWPVPMFFNGAAGNMHDSDPTRSCGTAMDEIGRILAEDVAGLTKKMIYHKTIRLGASLQTLSLPFRKITRAEVRGTVFGAQRFVDPAAYDQTIPGLVAKIRRDRVQKADSQVLFIGDWAVVGVPAEYFVEHGLRIKLEAAPMRALIFGFSNGMIGYVPTRDAFQRGGYETTFGLVSHMAPETGDLMADSAIRLIRREIRERTTLERRRNKILKGKKS
jgi:neutral ceramidase